MIQGCRYLRRSTDRWLLSKNSTTRLKDSKVGMGPVCCEMPITNTKGSYLYPCSNMIPSRPRVQHLLPNGVMSVSHPSSIRLLSLYSIHVITCSRIPFSFNRGTVLLPNDDILPTVDAFTECFEENLLPNGAFLPNSAHRSVSSLYQFLVLTNVPHKT
jgi:hypothetical protein